MAARVGTEKDDFLRAARKQFQAINAAESEIRASALEDMKFAYNLEEGQWPLSIRNERTTDQRPCLTSNKLRKFIGVVTNQLITSRPSIGVAPVDDKSDPLVAKVYEGLIRQIEYQSQASAIYRRTLEHSVGIGFGYWRVLSRYSEEGFDQELYLEGVKNPFSVYLDPEGEYAFIRLALLKADFERRYPKATVESWEEHGWGDEYRSWYTEDKVYVAEYFYKERSLKRLAQVFHPQMGETHVFELGKGIEPNDLTAQGYQVLRTRAVETHQVKWVKMTGADILEEQDWPGKDIPIIELTGDKQQIGDKLYKRSLIRDAKDPQRMYNYWLTAMTESIALVPKAPFLVTPEMIRGHEAMWEDANRKNRPYLYYNQSGKDKPSRERPPEVQSGALAMLKMADQDIKDVIGIFEPGLGDVSNERSGRAIRMRQDRSDLGTGHFQEEFRQALIRTGKLLIDLIPKIYDTERTVRLQGADDSSQLIPINHSVFNVETGQAVIVNDLSVGTYDVEATVRVYQTRREEATEMMIEALQYAPAVAPYILDLVFKYADWPGADEIAARIKAILPGLTPGHNGNAPPAGGNPAQPPSEAVEAPLIGG